MADDVFKAPKAKRKNDHKAWSSPKKRRTKDDFFTFCNIVLAYTQYESTRQEEMRSVNNSSPLGSVGSSVDSYSSESSLSSMSPSSSYGFNDDVISTARLRGGMDEEENLVTCFCMKPYGGRPMIECSSCLTWVHLSCAKIRKSKIPDTYVCQKCRDAQANPRKSSRMRTEKRRDSS